jgi:hypothetical protein
MNKLEVLRQDLLTMTPDERMSKLREVREDRKISKHAITVKAKRVKDKGAKLENMFAGMSEEDRVAFLKSLKE